MKLSEAIETYGIEMHTLGQMESSYAASCGSESEGIRRHRRQDIKRQQVVVARAKANIIHSNGRNGATLVEWEDNELDSFLNPLVTE
tara:strand:- start:6167 stop:6427 length:261 start_codon:yes stop_codon:yes gene_type:complete